MAGAANFGSDNLPFFLVRRFSVKAANFRKCVKFQILKFCRQPTVFLFVMKFFQGGEGIFGSDAMGSLSARYASVHHDVVLPFDAF